MILERTGELTQARRAYTRCERTPGRVGVSRAGNRRVNLGRTGTRDDVKHRLGGRLEH